MDKDKIDSVVLVKVSVFLFFLTIPYCFLFSYLSFGFWGIYYPLISSLIYLCSIFFTKNKLYSYSKFIIIINALFTLVFYSLYLGKEAGLHIAVLSFVVLPYAIFDKKNNLYKNICLAMIILSFFSINFLYHYSNPSFLVEALGRNLIFYTASIASFIVLLYSSYLHRNKIESFSEDLIGKNKSLENANKKLKETARQEVFLKMGREIQAQFLPEVPKELKICNSTYHFETMYKPSNEVSGDLYDFYVQNNKIKVFHSDVIGKNVPAMMVALNIHSELKRLLKQEDEEPQTLINELNKNIYDMRARMSGCVGVYYEIDTETKKLTYVHMGYEDIYLIRGKECIDIGSEGGPQLGSFENITYKQTSIDFEEGDILLTISDGMSDMKNEAGKRYSQDVGVKTYIERYVESVNSKTPETLKEWLETEINRHTGDTEVYADDISVFITRLSGS